MHLYPVSYSPGILTLSFFILLVNLLPWHVQPLTPAVLLYAFQDSPLPLLLSPFLVPSSWGASLARILQLGWLATQPPSPRLSLRYFVQLYPVLVAARAGTGYVFGRSVGWQYPRLFSHDAVYEPVAGFGPLVLGSLLFDETLLGGFGRRPQLLLIRMAVMLVFVLLDGMPWGYVCGAAIVGVHRLLHSFLGDSKYAVLPWHAPASSQAGTNNNNNNNNNTPPLSSKHIFLTSIAALVSIAIVGSTSSKITSLYFVLPPQPQDVHIVMLTVPRLRNLASDVMIESIQSYVEPWHVNANSSLTAFAHLGLDGKHVAFERAKAFFRGTSTSAGVGDARTRVLPITFHVEPAHWQGEPFMSHHAHLADAMRYANFVGHEWTMFVEDDFVLCDVWGWENLMRVMARLVDGGSKGKRFNGAFVGTGGSGLVFHRSLLPTLEHLLSVLASMEASNENKPMPADVLMQQCLSGELSFCPNDGYVISSRMLMGHRGGQISTGDRLYEDGKWACGWRHPKHGAKGAAVVVV